jgi:hypothetical protein
MLQGDTFNSYSFQIFIGLAISLMTRKEVIEIMFIFYKYSYDLLY